MKTFFIFDVESIGLHGDSFAVAGGIYLENGSAQSEFLFSCPLEEAWGDEDDRMWVKAHVPVMEATHRTPVAVREAFWAAWLDAKARYPDIVMAGECLWPVEANFLSSCLRFDMEARKWKGPYPFHEISSIMLAAGMDVMKAYERKPSELPAHNPLSDARLSARLLSEALAKLNP